MKVSYSRIETFVQCPYQYKLKYIEKLKTRFNLDPANPLVLGTAIHEGIEIDIEQAIRHYYANYPSLTKAHVLEAFKLEKLIPKAKAILPEGRYEDKVEYLDYIGFMDLLVYVGVDEEGNEIYDLYDFKYTNNIDTYMKSKQLHVYKYFFEKANPTKKIRKLYFVFIPKINRGPFESLEKYEERIKSKINGLEPTIQEVIYDVGKVKAFMSNTETCQKCKTFNKNPTRLCDWCDYKKYCQSNGADDTNIIYPDDYKKESED